MSESSQCEFCIRISLLTKKGKNDEKELYLDLKETLKKVSVAFPSDMRPMVEEECTITSNTKSNGEIKSILMIILLCSYAVRPILSFIVNLYREKKKKFRIVKRFLNANGVIQENEIEYEGTMNTTELKELIEDAVTKSRYIINDSTNSQKDTSFPNLEIIIQSNSGEEQK